MSVEQVYVNEGAKPIEADYVFPGSTQSAIHSMQMSIGGTLFARRDG
ncbi:MAG: VIT domain-containing protein [Flavobacteriales bacterium]